MADDWYPPSTRQAVGRQRLVIYERHGEKHVYSTAYNDEEGQRQVVACVSEHGKGCRARTVYGDQHVPRAA